MPKGRITIRLLLYTLLATIIAVSALVGFLIFYKPAPFEVAMQGTSEKLGSQYGRKFRVPIHLVSRFYLDRTVCRGDSKLIQTSRKAALESLQNWPQVYREELNATAAAAKVPPSALAFGNSFLDLGKVRAGCRSVVVSSSNLVLHAHNLDWDTLAGFGRWTTCVVRRTPSDGRFATVSIGFPGMIGALDVINEKGLALSFNQMGWGKGGTNEPVLIMLRRVAETCASLDQARTNLLHAAPGMPFIITVSDAASGEGSVFERAKDQVTERPLEGGTVAACNTLQGTRSGTTRLDQLLATTSSRNLETVQDLLGAPEVLMQSNIYSVIFDFQNNRLWLASGEVPAAGGNYREFRLFRLPRR
jgi:hypothetical protein